MELKRFVKTCFRFWFKLKDFVVYINCNYLRINKSSVYGYLDKHTTLQMPIVCANPKLVFLNLAELEVI